MRVRFDTSAKWHGLTQPRKKSARIEAGGSIGAAAGAGVLRVLGVGARAVSSISLACLRRHVSSRL